MDFTDYIVIKPWILEMKTYNIFRLVKIFHKGKWYNTVNKSSKSQDYYSQYKMKRHSDLIVGETAAADIVWILRHRDTTYTQKCWQERVQEKNQLNNEKGSLIYEGRLKQHNIYSLAKGIWKWSANIWKM